MTVREHIQAGTARWLLTSMAAVVAASCAWVWWPADVAFEEKLLSGLQKVAFVAAAFGVTAYNLRTRVVDLAMKVEGSPSRVDEFCRIARNCGTRLTNLVVFFTLTAIWLGALTIFREGTLLARLAGATGLAFFAAASVSFLYIVFAFERLERFAMDEAERSARSKEAARLLKP